nr:signal recognition particle 19 kDa protein-like [Nerophis lumbriciformis]
MHAQAAGRCLQKQASSALGVHTADKVRSVAELLSTSYDYNLLASLNIQPAFTAGRWAAKPPRMAHLTKNPADKERFICVYPVYINSKKTLAEGRRIPADKAVENPSCAEIRDVLTAAGMNVYMENKMHPREWNRDVQFKGRIRVQLKQEDGSLCLDNFATRKDVMFYVAEMIPKLKTRTQKSGAGESSALQGDGGKKTKKKKK